MFRNPIQNRQAEIDRRSSPLLRYSCRLNMNTRGGTRAHNLLLRREAPYPLGHTGGCTREDVFVQVRRTFGRHSTMIVLASGLADCRFVGCIIAMPEHLVGLRS